LLAFYIQKCILKHRTDHYGLFELKRPHEVIKSLCEFLNKPLTESQLNAIVEWCSFENMKRNPSVNYDWYKTLGLFRKEGDFFRKGVIGDWLNYYSRDDSVKLDSVLEKNLNYKTKFNYGISDKDLSKIYSVEQQPSPQNKLDK
jgi:hypothetical protein